MSKLPPASPADLTAEEIVAAAADLKRVLQA
jgi:hypothetical protein